MAVAIESTETLDKLQKRLRRIEGQVRGIQKMLNDERDCREVVQQLSAIRSAVHQVGLEVMRVYAQQCLVEPDGEMSEEEVLDYLFTTLGKWS